MAVVFSTDDEIDLLTDKDESTEVWGYIEQIFAISQCGDKKQYTLLKFILNNNGNRRITCLVWGNSLSEKYQHTLRVGQIISIKKAHCKAAHPRFYRSGNNLIPFEIMIQDHSVIENLGEFTPTTQRFEEARVVNFNTIITATGAVEIEGYIKSEFTKAQNRDKTMVYGFGSITNGQQKINIRITNFESSEITRGAFVTVKGLIASKEDEPMIIQCVDMNCIIEDSTVAKMTEDQLRAGSRMIKRARTE